VVFRYEFPPNFFGKKKEKKNITVINKTCYCVEIKQEKNEDFQQLIYCGVHIYKPQGIIPKSHSFVFANSY